MSKKHFILIAAAMKRNLQNKGNYEDRKQFAEEMCDVFAQINMNFDRSRFMEAAGF